MEVLLCFISRAIDEDDHYASLDDYQAAAQNSARNSINEKETCINEVYDEVKEGPTIKVIPPGNNVEGEEGKDEAAPEYV